MHEIKRIKVLEKIYLESFYNANKIFKKKTDSYNWIQLVEIELDQKRTQVEYLIVSLLFEKKWKKWIFNVAESFLQLKTTTKLCKTNKKFKKHLILTKLQRIV